MNNGYVFKFGDQTLILDPAKSLFWKEKKMVIVSDLHLGKAGHFRKSGIPIPTEIHRTDLRVLDHLIKTYHPDHLVFLGDLFHSDHNEEWSDFSRWMNAHQNVEMTLVKGNHDILSEGVYEISDMKVVEELAVPPFHFSHETMNNDLYNISGHVHPCVRLHGAARQGITLPCFYFGINSGILPSFGNFTGGYKIKPEKGARVFGVAEDQIIALEG